MNYAVVFNSILGCLFQSFNGSASGSLSFIAVQISISDKRKKTKPRKNVVRKTGNGSSDEKKRKKFGLVECYVTLFV